MTRNLKVEEEYQDLLNKAKTLPEDNWYGKNKRFFTHSSDPN